MSCQESGVKITLTQLIYNIMPTKVQLTKIILRNSSTFFKVSLTVSDVDVGLAVSNPAVEDPARV